ncbi:MAG: NAD(P)/FAD-dependent oxidoreductase [Coleofasciculaceae cyanobacterium RL_1_1]|nr:NAD(P)/FAD-dependent oxidoreductase [Coleofasciculaceae cyanobacterium RL_1_1]
MTQTPQRICILGGGFGGLYTALKLSEKTWDASQPVEITLVDRQDCFVFLPLLYELLSGELQSWEVAPPFVDLLADTNIRFVRAGVERVEIEARQVALDDGQTLKYDRLVLALGGETPTQSVSGVDDYAYGFRTIDDAYRLKEKLRELETSDRDPIRIAIVGGGYSGIELACTLADRLEDRGRLRLIDRHEVLLKSSSEFNREAARQALSDRDIWIDYETEIDAVAATSISLKYRDQTDTIPVDLVLWTVGMEVASVVRSLPVEHSDRGQVFTETTLQVKGHPEIFAIGDLADCYDASGQKVPTTAQVAFQQADYTAWNIWASLTDRPLLPFRYQNLGEMMTLGHDNATLSGLGISINGEVAHFARRLVYLYRLPTLKHQLNVGLNWIAKPIQDLLASLS